MKEKKTILICPLDWGLGHAARCVPLIQQFLLEGHQVIIGADKKPLAFLKQEFPNLKTIVVPGHNVKYGANGSALKLFYESFKFFNFIKEEHSLVDVIVEEHNIDLIVSDNRYGIWSKKVKSIIITHQLYVKVPIGKRVVHQQLEKLLANFNECWIPDVEGEDNLSGDLAHLRPFKHPHKFIGPLSRFPLLRPLVQVSEEFDVIAIISGPEPQRSIFEQLILEEIKRNKLKAIVVRGLPDEKTKPLNCTKDTLVFNHADSSTLERYILRSKVVVCRSGYSSIMDLVALRKSAILVPTPGQTEQEYLAKYHLGQGSFYAQKQCDFDLEKGLGEIEKFQPKLRNKNDLKLNLI